MADTAITFWAPGIWADDFWAAGFWSSADETESRPHKGRKGEKEPRVLEEEYELFYLIMAIAAGSSEFLH